MLSSLLNASDSLQLTHKLINQGKTSLSQSIHQCINQCGVETHQGLAVDILRHAPFHWLQRRAALDTQPHLLHTNFRGEMRCQVWRTSANKGRHNAILNRLQAHRIGSKTALQCKYIFQTQRPMPEFTHSGWFWTCLSMCHTSGVISDLLSGMLLMPNTFIIIV